MLHKLPKRAARIITNSSYEVRSADIFKTMHWEPIENILNRREQVHLPKMLCVYTCECICKLLYAHVHMSVHVCIYVYLCVCMCVNMCVCVYIFK